MSKICIYLLVIVAIWSANSLAAHFQFDEFHKQEQLIGKQQFNSNARFDVGGMAKEKYTPEAEKDPQFWRNLAYEEIASRLELPQADTRKAKNVIFFLGDGMSLPTLVASRIYKGQLKGNTGEEDALSFEKFPFTGLSRTYCANAQVADSACTATAYLCGVKTNIIELGVSANVEFNNCSAAMDPKNHVSSIAAWAQAAGKSTGIVTTTTLTHASPSGAYAHSSNRFFESDADILTFGEGKNDPATCMDIATQLITQKPGRNFDVMLGGGMGKFLPKTIKDSFGNMGERLDGKNLLERWQRLHPGGVLVTNRKQLKDVNFNKTSSLIGLFQSGVMDFHAIADNKVQPTLADMTEAAIKMLRKNKNGYVVFIEGGLIDYGHHGNVARLAAQETLQLEEAVQLARDMTNKDDTLIVVSSDHAHPLSISGYPGRGTNIFGLNQHDADDNGVKYATLNYAVGPNQYLDDKGNRVDLTDIIDGPAFRTPSYIKSFIGVHAGDDVGIFASGPQQHLFSGVMQQSTIPHLMAYAACIGDGPKLCKKNN